MRLLVTTSRWRPCGRYEIVVKRRLLLLQVVIALFVAHLSIITGIAVVMYIRLLLLLLVLLLLHITNA